MILVVFAQHNSKAEEVEGSTKGLNGNGVSNLCVKEVEEYYLKIFLASEGGTVRYPEVRINTARSDCVSGVDCDRYTFKLAIANPVDGITEPDCGSWAQDDDPGGGNPNCRTGTGCVFYSVGVGENIFSKASVKELEAAALVFGEKPSLGFVCGNADAVVNDGKNLPGYCCLDAPYQSDPWGTDNRP
jgi:hypothetical protein